MQQSNMSGRSMVEMLGVLAIMALLSVGAISAIRSALNSAKANDIVNAVNRRAIVWQSNKAFGQALDSSFPANELSYTWTPEDKGNYIDLTIATIDKAVCDKLQSLDWQNVFVHPDCTKISLKTDLSASTPTSDCGPCGTLNPIAGTCIDNDALCASGQSCYNGYCSSCQDGYFKNAKNTCVSCAGNTVTVGTLPSDTECRRCNGIRFYSPGNDRCTLCTEEKGGTTPELCFTCSDTFYATFYSDRYTCYYCDPKYGKLDRENRQGQNACQQTTECPEDYAWLAGRCRNCRSADFGGLCNSNYDQVKRCFGIKLTGGNYILWDAANKRGISCNDARDLPSGTKENCLVCNQPDSDKHRYWDQATQRCRPCFNGVVSDDGESCTSS